MGQGIKIFSKNKFKREEDGYINYDLMPKFSILNPFSFLSPKLKVFIISFKDYFTKYIN